MILTIRTDTMIATISIIDPSGREVANDTWEAGRNLAKDLLRHIDGLVLANTTWEELSGIVVFRGPGSFTGLRIGVTTADTIAYARALPIVGEMSDDWCGRGVERLTSGGNDKTVLPEYGADPHITAPKK